MKTKSELSEEKEEMDNCKEWASVIMQLLRFLHSDTRPTESSRCFFL